MCNVDCTCKERKKTNKKRGRRSASAVQQLSSKKKKRSFLPNKCEQNVYMNVCASKIQTKTRKTYEKMCVCPHKNMIDGRN